MRRAIHPEADAEFADAVGYYAEIAPDLGARFYREMERLIRDVCAYERLYMENWTHVLNCPSATSQLLTWSVNSED